MKFSFRVSCTTELPVRRGSAPPFGVLVLALGLIVSAGGCGKKVEPGTEISQRALASAAACQDVRLVASRDYKPARRQDAVERFSRPVAFLVPPSVVVTEGRSGHGVTLVAIEVSGGVERGRDRDDNHGADDDDDDDRDDKKVTCVYRGQARPKMRPEEREALGGLYLLETCSHRVFVGTSLSVTKITMSVLSGDADAGKTVVELLSTCGAGEPVSVSDIPPDAGLFDPVGEPPTPVAPDEISVPPQPGEYPDPFVGSSTPEDEAGTFTPEVDPELQPEGFSLPP